MAHHSHDVVTSHFAALSATTPSNVVVPAGQAKHSTEAHELEKVPGWSGAGSDVVLGLWAVHDGVDCEVYGSQKCAT